MVLIAHLPSSRLSISPNAQGLRYRKQRAKASTEGSTEVVPQLSKDGSRERSDLLNDRTNVELREEVVVGILRCVQ